MTKSRLVSHTWAVDSVAAFPQQSRSGTSTWKAVPDGDCSGLQATNGAVKVLGMEARGQGVEAVTVMGKGEPGTSMLDTRRCICSGARCCTRMHLKLHMCIFFEEHALWHS